MPFSTMPAGSPAAKLWEKIYNESKKAGDSEEVAARKAWAGVKSAGYKKVNDKWVKENSLVEFSMIMTHGADMRWKMTASDTKKDAYDERMTLPLYQSFIENINSKREVPEAFRALVTSDYWKGGMPYLSVSHYPDLNGFGVPGIPERVYIDGETFKAKGKFFDTKLGKACYKSLSEDDKTPEDNKIRVSIAFLDLAHQHGDGPVFRRNSLTDTCPQCEEGIGDKQYLDGYLVHFAMTRVPVNKRASMEVEKSMTTRKQDAESIIDPELADELEKKALLIGKSEAIVEFSEADEDPVEVSEAEEQDAEFVEGDPEKLPMTDDPNPVDPDELIVEEADLEKARASQKARSKKYGIAILAQGHVTKPSKWASVPDSQWGDPVNYRYPMPDDAHVRNAASRYGQEKGGYRGKGVVGKRIARKEHSKGIGEKSMTEPVEVKKTEVLAEGTTPITVETPSEEGYPTRINPGVWATAQGQNAIDTVFQELRNLMDSVYMRSDANMDMRATSLNSIFEDLKSHIIIKPLTMAEPIMSLVDAVTTAKSMTGTDEEKLTSVQPALNALGEAIKSEVTPPKPVDPNEVLLSMKQQLDALAQSNEQLRNDMAVLRSQATQPKQPVNPTIVPKPRSISPTLVQQAQVTTKKEMTPTEKLIFSRAGLTPQ